MLSAIESKIPNNPRSKRIVYILRSVNGYNVAFLLGKEEYFCWGVKAFFKITA
jgi:hypothetical protein